VVGWVVAAHPSRHGKEVKARRLAIATAVVFFVSLLFPIGVGVVNDTTRFPRFWGIMDVVIAFILVTLAILIAVRFERRVTDEIRLATYRAYRVVINVVLLLLILLFLAGDRLTWTYFLPGLAWRFWLLFYCWPTWLAALRS